MFSRVNRQEAMEPPISTGELLLEHANIFRQLAAELQRQHITLMMVTDQTPANTMARDSVDGARKAIEDGAVKLQELAAKNRRRTIRMTPARFGVMVGLALAVAITTAPFMLLGAFTLLDYLRPVQVASQLHNAAPNTGGSQVPAGHRR